MESKYQKAVVYTNQSPNFFKLIENHPVPQPDKKNVLIQVHSVALNPVDYKLPSVLGIFIKNKLLCHDFSGKVTYVPPHVTHLKVGDEVFGFNSGVFAEILSVSPDSCVLKPSQLSHQQAAGLPLAGQTSLQSLRTYGKLKQGETDVLIIGGSGGCGYLGVQLSKILGAKSITAICSQKNADFVKNFGADKIHDYNSSEGMLPKNGKFDLIYDTVSSPEDYDYYPEGFKLLKSDKSSYIGINGSKRDWVGTFASKLLGNWVQKKQYQLVLLKSNQKDLGDLALWAQQGKLKSIVDSEFEFTQEGVQKAFDRMKSRRAVGKIIVNIKQ